MNKKINILLSICLLLVITMILRADIKGTNKNIKDLQQIYFEIVQDDISGETISSRELNKNIDNILSEDESYRYESFEEKESEDISKSNIHQFKNRNEDLEVSYIESENNEKNTISSISYEFSKEDSSSCIGSTYIKREQDTYVLGTMVYSNNLDEQKKAFDMIQNKNEVDEIYNIYYELAQYIEEDKNISINQIENIVDKKLENIGQTSEDTIFANYTINKDRYNINILYNVDESKIESIEIETEYVINGVNLYYSKDKSNRESSMVVMVNKSLEEQEQLIGILIDDANEV